MERLQIVVLGNKTFKLSLSRKISIYGEKDRRRNHDQCFSINLIPRILGITYPQRDSLKPSSNGITIHNANTETFYRI